MYEGRGTPSLWTLFPLPSCYSLVLIQDSHGGSHLSLFSGRVTSGPTQKDGPLVFTDQTNRRVNGELTRRDPNPGREAGSHNRDVFETPREVHVLPNPTTGTQEVRHDPPTDPGPRHRRVPRRRGTVRRDGTRREGVWGLVGDPGQGVVSGSRTDTPSVVPQARQVSRRVTHSGPWTLPSLVTPNPGVESPTNREGRLVPVGLKPPMKGDRIPSPPEESNTPCNTSD